MKVLAIDSSGITASAAVADGNNVIAEFTVNNRQTHSQTLLPMVDKVVKMSEVPLADIYAIAVAAGPGSFTGLRIGSATAKGLGLALGKPVVPVPSLDGLAYRAACYSGIICPLMDARRNQVYAAAYHITDGRLVNVIGQKASDIKEILSFADAILLGIENFSVNFTEISLDELRIVVEDVKSEGKEIFLSLNRNFHNGDLKKLEEILVECNKLKVDGIFYYDVAVYQIHHRLMLDLPLVWSA